MKTTYDKSLPTPADGRVRREDDLAQSVRDGRIEPLEGCYQLPCLQITMTAA